MRAKLWKQITAACMTACLSFSMLAMGGCKTSSSQESESSVASSTEETSQSIEISNTALTMQIGAESYLSTNLQDVTWKSSNESIVTVDQDGIVFAVAQGQATITVSKGSLTAECVITVVKSLKESTYVSFESNYLGGAYVGLSFALNACMICDDMVNDAVEISYQSSNESILSISNGVATVLAAGESVLTASAVYDGKTYTESLTFVTVDEYATFNFTNVQRNGTLNLNEEFQIEYIASLNGENVDNAEIEWSSSDNLIVSVENGILKGLSTGIATITAKYKNAEKAYIVRCLDNYLQRFQDENSLSNLFATRTSWGSSLNANLEIVEGEVNGRTPTQGAFLKFSFQNDVDVYSLGLTLRKVIDIETLKYLYAYGATEVCVPVFMSSKVYMGAFDGASVRGEKEVKSGEWVEFCYNLKDFISWCEMNGGNFNQTQDKPLFFMIVQCSEFTMYMDSIYIR